jgi:hypothetical protein
MKLKWCLLGSSQQTLSVVPTFGVNPNYPAAGLVMLNPVCQRAGRATNLYIGPEQDFASVFNRDRLFRTTGNVL